MNTSDSGADWSNVQPHLDQALELEPELRAAWLADLETTQPQIAQAVRAMLAHCEALSRAGFLQTPLLARAGATAAQLRSMVDWQGGNRDAWHELTTGHSVGPYELIRSIGQGGMSSVWLATRRDGQLKREVALKLPCADSPLRLELFERERDVLASLTHPQIARLYEAGISSTGQPYLAMEYVDGTALLASCEARRLGLRERLQLFLQVLGAVQFAHSALIIHRDLKPSNILVTPQGRVVLLDFGISKLLTAPSTHATRLGRALTPDYASPEQIAGRPLGTACDIYSLGVILYELLTGLRPYRLRHASQAAVEEAILGGELRAPSEQVVASSPRPAAARRILARMLRGDLDTIVLKALKKAPAERYASASAFAQDLNNYLEGLPVSARPDSFWYRAGRFVARHRAAVVSASAAALVLICGSLWIYRQNVQEENFSRRTNSLNARYAAVIEFLGWLMKESPQSQQPLTLSEMLARGERLALQDSGGPPENRAAVLEMLADHYFNLSDVEHAGRLMAEAVALLAASPDRALRGRAICKLAVIRADADNAAQAIDTIMREVDAPGADPETAAQCLRDRAIIDAHLERGADVQNDARSGMQRLASAHVRADLLEAQLLSWYAYGTHLQGHPFEAQQSFERALRRFQALGRERSEDALNVLNNWAMMILELEPRRALELLQQVVRIERTREPDAVVDPVLATNRALALRLTGRSTAALEAYEALCGTVTATHVACLQGLAALLLDLQQPERAAGYLTRSAQLIGTARRNDPKHVTQALLEGHLALLSRQFLRAGQQLDWILRAGQPSSAVWRRKAELALAQSQAGTAVAHAQQALQLAKAAQQGFEYSQQTGLAWLTLGQAQQALGTLGSAREAFAAAVKNLENTVDAEHPRLLEARRLLAQ